MKTNDWLAWFGSQSIQLRRRRCRDAGDFSGVAIIFKSRTASASRIPHVATVVALVLTIAVGVMQSGSLLAG